MAENKRIRLVKHLEIRVIRHVSHPRNTPLPLDLIHGPFSRIIFPPKTNPLVEPAFAPYPRPNPGHPSIL
jgi:hypothetical protein